MNNTETFNTFTQYDKQFNDMFKDKNKKGYACTYFSLISVWKFINGEDPTKESHEKTIRQSLLLQSMCDIDFGLTFEELLVSYTNIKPSNIQATTPELINNEIIGFNDIFKPLKNNTRKGVILLKNERYIIVLIDKTKFYVRDCHEKKQINFTEFNDLVKYFNKTYQFNKNINLSGIDYSDYSSIEFLNIDDEFELNFSDQIELKKKPSDKQYLEMLNAQLNDSNFGDDIIDFD